MSILLIGAVRELTQRVDRLTSAMERIGSSPAVPSAENAPQTGAAPEPTLAELSAKIDRLLTIVEGRTPPREVMNAVEAMEFVGKGSRSAFHRWCRKLQVRECGHGRYSLRSLKAAMEREARKTLDRRRAE